MGTHGNNQGQVDFAIRQTMTYYFEDGSPVIFDKDKTALLSFASRNNSFEFGEQEFVQLESNLTFIPITGSSVSGENSYVAARGSNNSKADGSKFDRSEWDQDGHENEYYGAGVALVTGGEISFTFGIRYNPQDIQKASKPSALRDRSRQWFTVNADIKARGLINTEKPGNPPVAPTKPSILSKNLETPSKPVKPTEPTYSVSNKPTAPKKPQLKEIPPLPPLTVEAVKPTPPKAPVVFLHQILYKVPPTAITINRPSRPIIPTKPSNQTRPKPVNPVAKTRLSKTNTVPSRTYPTPARQYSLGQKISYTPIYSPSTQIYYPSYTPSWTPARPTSPSPSSPTPPKNNPSGNTGKSKKPKKPIKAEEAKDPKDHFGINTGISKKSGDQQKLIAFIKEVGQKAREQNKHLKHNKKLYNDAVNKDISTALAHRDYSTDKLQKLLTKFGSAPKGQVTIDGMSVLSKNHTDPNARIDLSHSMATLASTYNHGPIRSAIKSIGSIGSYPIIVFPPNMPFLGLLNYKFINYNINKSTLQLNSFVGDIYTTMNIDDVNADIDSMILARHPKFKNLPMDQRIIKYYSTPNLDSKRKKLFWSLYSDNKEEAQQKAINEILISLLTVGGIGLIMYSKGTGKFSLAKGNIELLDKEIFDGKLRKRLEMSHGSYFNPFSSTNKNSSKGFPKITLPKIKLPKISLPAVTLPKIKLPKINLSKWNPPKINLPKWNPPKINLPKWNPPKNTSRKKGRKK